MSTRELYKLYGVSAKTENAIMRFMFSKMINSDHEVIETSNMPLDEWLHLVFNPPPKTLFIDYEFPTDKHRSEYIDTIHQRSESEVCKLLEKFLIPTGTLGTDEWAFEDLIRSRKSAPDLYKRRINHSYFRRLFLFATKKSKIPPWEGITWVVDLLPYSPKKALEALDSYIFAHIPILPDGRIEGLFDAGEIIRAKYIGIAKKLDEKIQVLLSISPRDFEHIIERLYAEMDYKTELTPAQKDGGRDIIAYKNEKGKQEQLRIECKQYSKPVGVELVRALLGVVADEKVNKGVLVTTSRFTKSAKDFARKNPRLEIISAEELIPLLNTHLGTNWTLSIERIIAESLRNKIETKLSE